MSDRGIGTSVFDAGMATFGKLYSPFLKKAKEKIEDRPVSNVYMIIVPQKCRIKPDKTGGSANFPEEYKKIAEEMMSAAGLKKGSAFKYMKEDIYYYYKILPNKKYIYVATFTSPAAYFLLRTQVQICFRCCDYTEEFKKEITESAEVPKEKVDLTKYFSFDDNDGVDSSLVNIDNDSEKAFYRDPIYNKAIMEHFNMLDNRTRKVLLSMNEAGQNSVLMSLTSKLYDKIVEKCDDIDYGDIPKTKGDITKLPNYESLKETISIMHNILNEYKLDTSPVEELSVAYSNIEARKDLFERAYSYNSELPIAM